MKPPKVQSFIHRAVFCGQGDLKVKANLWELMQIQSVSLTAHSRVPVRFAKNTLNVLNPVLSILGCPTISACLFVFKRQRCTSENANFERARAKTAGLSLWFRWVVVHHAQFCNRNPMILKKKPAPCADDLQ